MNQILVTDVENTSQSNGMKPVIKFFCVAAIIFALILVGEGGFYFYKKAKNNGGNLFSFFNKTNTSNQAEDGNKDKSKPVISIENANGKLLVTAKDETEIAYLSYQWEGAEEKKFNPSEEDKTTVKQEIEVQKGTQKLTLTAVDTAGNIETTTKKIIGSNGPEIKASLSEGNIVVKVTDEFGITKIVYTHNEEEHTVEGIPANAKEFEFKVALKDGDNYLKINAYENSIMTEYKCKKTR